jgi:osmoprotectant transport system substrate-binding protein
VALAIAAVLLVCGCGASGSSSRSSSAGSSATPAVSSGPRSKPTTPNGKSLTLGTKDFSEEFIIGQLYKQALEAKGYTVIYRENIGATEIVDRALVSGQIDAYPEYTGESVATAAKITTPVASPQQEYNLARAFYARRGQALSAMTPFFDADAVAVTKAYARAHSLVTTADLAKVKRFTFGARPEFQGRQQGVAGMRSAYGLNNLTFRSLALGIEYQALDSGAVDAIDAFTTDPQLASGKYTVLTDPKDVFGFQNIALVISKRKLAQLGGSRFLSIIDAVNSRLTIPAVIAMNKAAVIDGQSPAVVAARFLRANGLT